MILKRKVICIEPSDLGFGIIKGEIYDIVEVPKHNRHNMLEDHYYILDKKQRVYGHHKKLFMTLQEYRKLKLKNILI